MKIQANLLDKSFSYKILVLIVLMLVGFVVGTTLSYLMLMLLNNSTDLGSLANINTLPVNQLLLMQTFSVSGIFIAPALIFNKLFDNNFLKILPNFQFIILSILIVISAIPFVNWLAAFNSKMQLPTFLNDLEVWMKQSELKAEFLTKKILGVTTYTGFLLNILVVAVIAAISEEFIFRGVLQNTFAKHGLNIHASIWLTAILFSAIHMQFYGFIPRMLLGGMLGYLYYWSSSLWIPIFAHFTNNFIGVCLGFAIANNKINSDIENIGSNGYLFPITSFLVLVGLLYYFYIQTNQKN